MEEGLLASKRCYSQKTNKNKSSTAKGPCGGESGARGWPAACWPLGVPKTLLYIKNKKSSTAQGTWGGEQERGHGPFPFAVLFFGFCKYQRFPMIRVVLVNGLGVGSGDERRRGGMAHFPLKFCSQPSLVGYSF